MENNITYLVYLHLNKINGKVYVGQTYHSNPIHRWGYQGNGYRTQPFYRAIQKYGWNNFEHIILEDNISESLITERESYWIQYYHATDPQYGYNIRDGSSWSSKMRQQASENWDLYNNREEKRKLMIHLNKTLDRTGKNNPMYGTTRRGKNSGNKKKVQCIETGDIFDTVTDASRWCHPEGKPSLRSHIAQQIQGKRQFCGKHPITGVPLHWKYIETDKESE